MVGLPELINALGTRIQAIGGDVCQPNLGLDKNNIQALPEKTTHIIHTAADWRFLPLDELRKTNVQGTANVIAFAKEANKHHAWNAFLIFLQLTWREQQPEP